MSIKDPPDMPVRTAERRKLQAEAMRQMRAARDAIDPALLERARELIIQSAPDLVEDASSAMDAVSEDETVDKVRTLTVLKEFLLLKRDNKALCGEIRTMLTTDKK